jgi:uncharacterized Zn-binding protein involved in type VI secretion
MGKPAAKQGDKITATDTHILMVPTPGGPVPTPTPMPFVGTIMSGCSTDVFIEGKPAATVDSVAMNQPVHIPAAGPFQKPPTNQGKIMVGSTGVFINGKPAARQGDMAMTCNDPTDMPIGQVVAVGMVSIGETGAGAPKPPAKQSPKEQKLVKAKFGQQGKIVEAKWEKEEAKCGDEVKLKVSVKDFEDGTKAKFTIWEEDENGEDNYITEIEGEVQAGKVETSWVYTLEAAKGQLEKDLEYGEEEPKFFFSVDIEGSEARSQTLKFTYLLEIDLEDETGESLEEIEYTITFANGSEKKGKLKKGKITINDAPLGKYTLAIDGYDFALNGE